MIDAFDDASIVLIFLNDLNYVCRDNISTDVFTVKMAL